MDENKIKNKIIAISGEPVSGKGTTVKKMIEKLKEQGYTDEQIHLETTGNDFRRYFNSLIDLIVNLDNKEELNQIYKREELSEFFDNEVYRKTLARTIAQLKQRNIDLSTFTINEANNSEEFKDIRKIVDTLIDERMANKGKEINKELHPKDIWIIDSRLAFYNIPEAFSVRLTTNADVAGKRLFNDNSRGKEDKYSNIEEAKKEREMRRIGENTRYMNRYRVDLTDENNYDLIIDTSYSTVDDIADVILEGSKYYEKNKNFAKKWASPKIFLPLQKERETLAKSPLSNLSIDDMIKSIKEYGYLPNSTIEVVNVDNVNYIIEGHHRNFAAAYCGKTLVPYEVLARDDEKVEKYNRATAREWAEALSKSMLTGHEWLIKEQDPDFDYQKIYPNIWKILEEKEEKSR